MDEIIVPALSPEAATAFKVVNTHCTRVLNTILGDINFADLTLEQAETLFNNGFYYLERIISEPLVASFELPVVGKNGRNTAIDTTDTPTII